MAETNFVDYVKLFCASKRRRRFRASAAGQVCSQGGPDGGDGGRGGHIILRVNPQLWTLIHLKFRKHIRAGHGEPGRGKLAHGADGEDQIVEVPAGTVVRRAEDGELITELTQPSEEYVLCRGGKGGLGNNHFKSATRQTPRYAQPGENGQEDWFILELKLLADVGLVGFPNAGKSTLLATLSAARPKIADYPFTTLVPQLGIVSLPDNRSFVMADIPGIIEGAHEGKGLGLRFLRHIERNSMLLFMVPADSPDITAEYRVLLAELRKFKPELIDKQRMLAVTKADLLDEQEEKSLQRRLPRSVPVLLISSITGKIFPNSRN